jgi:hypothetical protein
MSCKRLIRYRIENMTPVQEECVKWAVHEWRKDLKGAIEFTEDYRADWQFSFSQHPNFPDKIARCDHISDTVKGITFDPRERWATNWFWRALGRSCLRTYALHEIGHALGLGHSEDPSNFMHPLPGSSRIDPESVKQITCKS